MNTHPAFALRRAAAVLLALLVALLLVPAGSANAADQPPTPTLKLGLGPAVRVPANQVVDGRPYLVYAANPGATLFDRVALFNYDRKPLKVQVYATDAVQSSDGAFGLLPGDTTPQDAGKWITLQGIPKDGIVTIPGRTTGAFGIKYVKFTAKVPRDASPGDHVGGVVASLKVVGKNKQGANVTLDQRIGLRAYFSLSGKLDTTLAIEDLHASYENQWDPRGLGKYTVSYWVHNKGNLRMDVSQDVNVKRCIIAKILCPAGTLTAHPAALENLLPGGRVKVTQVFTDKFGLGRPKAEVVLHAKIVDSTYAKTKVPDVSASIGFWALPWLLIIEILVVLLLIGLAVWRYERRRRLKKRELEEAASRPAPKHAL
jgi:opacity protein-like surface antigen